MLEDWIDAVQDVWRSISVDEFTRVNAPYLLKKPEFPTAINAEDLSRTPIALTIVNTTKFVYSAGGPNLGYYMGRTQFHVASSDDLSLLPTLLKWPRLIVVAAAANLKLGSLVDHFVLQDRDDQIDGPIPLQFGDETPHWGFEVYWEVKESVNTAITVATGA
jgi:hypothetical protein